MNNKQLNNWNFSPNLYFSMWFELNEILRLQHNLLIYARLNEQSKLIIYSVMLEYYLFI